MRLQRFGIVFQYILQPYSFATAKDGESKKKVTYIRYTEIFNVALATVPNSFPPLSLFLFIRSLNCLQKNTTVLS